MINVSHVRSQIDATNSEMIAVPKVQMVEILAEVEIGQHARRSINNIRCLISIAANASALSA